MLTALELGSYQTLRGLYFGTISSITNQPGDATYTLATLKQAVSQILAARQPARVRTLDHLSDFDGGDHDDHLTTGRLIKEVVGSASVSGFMGYPVQNLPPTLSTTSTAFQRKSAALFAYAPYDSAMCQSLSACSGRGESSWLQREYAVTPTLATKSSSGAPQTPVTLPSGTNIAPLAVASSSSDEGSSVPSAAIDGVVSGYPRNGTAEWASDHQGAGAWLRLTWSKPVSVSAVVLYDRPNENDWLKAGTLAFSDGSSVGFTNPVNDGSATVIQLSRTYTTTSLLLTVTQVSSATVSVGISELQGTTLAPAFLAVNGSVDLARVLQSTALWVLRPRLRPLPRHRLRLGASLATSLATRRRAPRAGASRRTRLRTKQSTALSTGTSLTARATTRERCALAVLGAAPSSSTSS